MLIFLLKLIAFLVSKGSFQPWGKVLWQTVAGCGSRSPLLVARLYTHNHRSHRQSLCIYKFIIYDINNLMCNQYFQNRWCPSGTNPTCTHEVSGSNPLSCKTFVYYYIYRLISHKKCIFMPFICVVQTYQYRNITIHKYYKYVTLFHEC